MEERSYTHLRKDLRDRIVTPVWPSGVRPAPFVADRYLKPAHDLLAEAYEHGGGHVRSLNDWWSALSADPEYDPAVFFLALDGMDHVIGLAQCWTGSFLKDLVVSKAWRRMGVGEALLLHAFAVFRRRGSTHFDLKVEDENPSGAERLYHRMGMTPVG